MTELVAFLESRLKKPVNWLNIRRRSPDFNFWYEQGAQFLENGESADLYEYDDFEFIVVAAAAGPIFFTRDAWGYFVQQD